MNFRIKHTALFIVIGFSVLVSSCDLFRSNQEKIEIPAGITEEQLQDARYKYKRDAAYKEKYLYQNKTDSTVITIFNIIKYNIKDDGTNIGEGYDYYIFDIGVDNPNNYAFNIGSFVKSCHLTNQNPIYLYSNVGFALKMYYLQSDSSSVDMDYMNRFYTNAMPAKDFLRTKLFAFEVSKQDKDPLFFHYRIGNQKYEFKVRDEVY